MVLGQDKRHEFMKKLKENRSQKGTVALVLGAAGAEEEKKEENLIHFSASTVNKRFSKNIRETNIFLKAVRTNTALMTNFFVSSDVIVDDKVKKSCSPRTLSLRCLVSDASVFIQKRTNIICWLVWRKCSSADEDIKTMSYIIRVMENEIRATGLLARKTV